jgi:hypothetical protein
MSTRSPHHIPACFQDRRYAPVAAASAIAYSRVLSGQAAAVSEISDNGRGIRNTAISSNFQFTNEEPVIMIIRKGCWIWHAGQITAGKPARRPQHLE